MSNCGKAICCIFCKYFHVAPGCMWIYLAPFSFLYTLLGQPNKHLITDVLIIVDGAVKPTLQHLPINKQTAFLIPSFELLIYNVVIRVVKGPVSYVVVVLANVLSAFNKYP